MKKNVKYLGMAAAALLAVAPVAVSGVANAATITVTPGNASTPAANTTINVALNVTNLSSLTGGESADRVAVNLTATANGQNVNANLTSGSQAWVIPANETLSTTLKDGKPSNAVDRLVAGQSYKVVATGFGFTGLTSNATYNFTGAVTGSHTASAFGNIGGDSANKIQVVSDPFTVAANGTGYFVNSSNGVQTSSVNAEAPSANTVSAYTTAVENAVRGFNANPGNTNANITQIAPNVESLVRTALRNAGVTVNSDGSFSAPSANVTVPYTVTFSNGASATLNVVVPVHAVANTTDPVISVKSANASNFTSNNGAYNYNNRLALGSSFDANTIASQFQAQVSSDQNATIPVTVASNNVNTAVAGTYQVVLSATNPAGRTSRVTVNVRVGNEGQVSRKVNYVKGYKVVLWNVNGNTVRNSGRTVDADSTVTTDGNPVTVAGVSYYKIANSNDYIQAQYVDGSWKPATKPSTNSSNEEKVSGVATVVYNGRGGVKLLNGEGKYQSQVVPNGSSWKVFARKTINGKTYYRLGNDNQWIPAQYVNFR